MAQLIWAITSKCHTLLHDRLHRHVTVSSCFETAFHMQCTCTHRTIIATTISWRTSFSKADDVLIMQEVKFNQGSTASVQRGGVQCVRVNVAQDAFHADLQAHDTTAYSYIVLHLDVAGATPMLFSKSTQPRPKQICLLWRYFSFSRIFMCAISQYVISHAICSSCGPLKNVTTGYASQKTIFQPKLSETTFLICGTHCQRFIDHSLPITCCIGIYVTHLTELIICTRQQSCF